MKIEISGSRCVSCHWFNQYYAVNASGELNPIDCGYCGMRSKNARPGDRCKEYQEKSNVSAIYAIKECKK